MDLFDVLSLIGGLCLFLFGMNLMGSALEKRAGGSLNALLSRLTSNKLAGFLTGLGVTAVIQSSSATTVMVVGFVNSGIMTLKQAINVIMGANVGTTVTAWLISLSGIEGDSLVLKLLKPTSFTPILALIGVIFFMFCKSGKKKDTGVILLGFATLMFGMDAMSDAVAGLRDVPEFANILLMFTNPILGVLAGAVLTGIIQSSSASVGILQALSSTGAVTIGAAIPIIMGQNIGTCVTALLSSVGTTKNARRTAVVHLSFNIIGTVVLLTLFWIIKSLVNIPLISQSADEFSIAVTHSIFNILCTALLLPCAGLLEKLACKIIPDAKEKEEQTHLDERLLATPSIAIERCRVVAGEMATVSMDALRNALEVLRNYDADLAARVKEQEDESDRYEDELGTYLVKLSAHDMSDEDSAESAKLLHMISDFERISDHAINIVESARELHEKGMGFSEGAAREMDVICRAVLECLDMSLRCFLTNDQNLARQVEPLEDVVDLLKDQLRTRHVLRLQKGECSIEAGFVWNDLLTSLERVSDHCSNIASCVIEMSHASMDLHGYLHGIREEDPKYTERYEAYAKKYALMS